MKHILRVILLITVSLAIFTVSAQSEYYDDSGAASTRNPYYQNNSNSEFKALDSILSKGFKIRREQLKSIPDYLTDITGGTESKYDYEIPGIYGSIMSGEDINDLRRQARKNKIKNSLEKIPYFAIILSFCFFIICMIYQTINESRIQQQGDNTAPKSEGENITTSDRTEISSTNDEINCSSNDLLSNEVGLMEENDQPTKNIDHTLTEITTNDTTTYIQNTMANSSHDIKDSDVKFFKKLEYQEYQKVLKANGINHFYHFTDIRNIPTIVKYGGLYSWWASEQLGINVAFSGGDDYSKDLDYAKSLQNYIHLSLCNDHPMMHHVKQRGAHLVLLKISTLVATFADTLFADRNATDKNCLFGSTIADLKHINFPATQRQFIAREDDDFKFHQAEILVKSFIPIEYILNIGDVIKEVKDILPTQQNSAQTSSDSAHQSSLNATEAPNRDYQTYNKWSVIKVQKFTQEEIDLVDHATVVETSYGASCCFFMKNGHTLFIPMSTDAKAEIGDPVNLNEAEILTLHKHGETNIMRIRA